MEKLRDEILQSERTRADLLKWKLALVGVVGAVGLGFSGTQKLRHANLVLCVIPPVCVYVDLLCRHLTLKMLVIGSFLQDQESSGTPETQLIAQYEKRVQNARHLSLGGARTGSAFALEDWALWGSTIALSIALFSYGVFLWSPFSLPFVISAAAGVAATAAGAREYSRRSRAVEGSTPK